MNAVALLRAKRDGRELSTSEIAALVRGYTSGEVPDYQMAAFLMAVVWRGMSERETLDLTQAMVRSGQELRVREVLSPVVDKHSTGGVGDKATLIVAPLLAACGLSVAKMTGRGLGHTGGTVDKLESVRGLRMALGRDEFLAVLQRTGLALSAQSAELAPADGAMYALRDVTATIESIPLIAASIMSKKLAVGPSHLLLDVKVGSGAFMKTEAEARRLALAMVRLGEDAGVRTVAVLSAMEQPLGNAVGNALEVAEAVDVLRGEGPADVAALCLHEAATLLHLAGVVPSEAAGEARARAAMASGAAVEKLAEVLSAQGGDASQILDTSRLPQAAYRETLAAPQSGVVAAIDAERIGVAAMHLGAGRLRKGDAIDHSVGLVLRAKVGAAVTAGAPLLDVHARSAAEAQAIRADLLAAYTWGTQPVAPGPLLLGTFSREQMERPGSSAGA